MSGTITANDVSAKLRHVADILDGHPDLPAPWAVHLYSGAPEITWRVDTDADGDGIRDGLADLSDLWWLEHVYEDRGRILTGFSERVQVTISTEVSA